MLFYQKFSSSASLSLLLLSNFAFSIPTAPGRLVDRQEVSSAIASTALSASPLISTAAVTTDAPTTTLISASAAPTTSDPATNRTKCSPKECPKYCTPSNSSSSLPARSLGLSKRFFEIPSTRPGTFVNQLLTQSYTDDLSPDPTKYVWHSFANNAEYASAIKGLSGCTAVFAASANGVFSAHIWEEDVNTNADLQPANYQSTLNTMKAQLSPHKDDLAGGEVFIILPTLTRARRVYSDAINQAIEDAVNEASGLTATVSIYTARQWDSTPGFGDDERGAMAFQFDPNYQTSGNRAYRIYQENNLLSEKTGL
ncbi:MAG: hypothetical protein HETSPECPRED_004576 [Heterodermia speciosa]|uniref:Uncharacterized protein n=1 Tax=Heterodermia speciosa TaxID=116794 RepID=A0A8H3IB26_9LECA|nr:MAG: hypothetical protein HETSPECPRED_004576 [Heterodermia speciosa]